MNQSLGKRAVTSLKVSSETTHLRRRLMRADQLFSEGLSRLQSDYKARVKAAVSDEPEMQEETPAPPATSSPAPATKDGISSTA